jgi:hypothetical protein
VEAARAYEHLAESYYFSDEVLRAFGAILQTVNLAGSAQPTAELARGYADMSVFAGHIPLPRVADWYARRARMTAEDVGELSTLAWTSIPTSVFRIDRAIGTKWSARSGRPLSSPSGWAIAGGESRPLDY